MYLSCKMAQLDNWMPFNIPGISLLITSSVFFLIHQVFIGMCCNLSFKMTPVAPCFALAGMVFRPADSAC